MEEQNIKSSRAGRPRITDEEKLKRLEETRIKNKETQRLLRENNPEKCREYRVRYYHKHKEGILKAQTGRRRLAAVISEFMAIDVY